jgi:hypothetical protein
MWAAKHCSNILFSSVLQQPDRFFAVLDKAKISQE